MALDLNNFRIDRNRIAIPKHTRSGEKSAEMHKFFSGLSVGDSFTLPRKDTAYVRKLFHSWTVNNSIGYRLIGRSTSDPRIYRFWIDYAPKSAK